jgi:hypothetical protein
MGFLAARKALRMNGGYIPALGNHVAHIIGATTNKQVRWITADWIVAVVTDILAAFENHSIRGHKDGTMGGRYASIIERLAVSILANMSSPRPAFIG